MNRDFDVCSANRELLHECLMDRNATVNVCALGRLSALDHSSAGAAPSHS